MDGYSRFENFKNSDGVYVIRAEDQGSDLVPFFNLTPHPFDLILPFGHFRFLPTGVVARRAVAHEAWPSDKLGDGVVEVSATRFGLVEGLPAPQPGVIFIVSGMVLDAPEVVDRDDLRAPDTAPDAVVRGPDGRVMGVKRLRVQARPMPSQPTPEPTPDPALGGAGVACASERAALEALGVRPTSPSDKPVGYVDEQVAVPTAEFPYREMEEVIKITLRVVKVVAGGFLAATERGETVFVSSRRNRVASGDHVIVYLTSLERGAKGWRTMDFDIPFSTPDPVYGGRLEVAVAAYEKAVAFNKGVARKRFEFELSPRYEGAVTKCEGTVYVAGRCPNAVRWLNGEGAPFSMNGRDYAILLSNGVTIRAATCEFVGNYLIANEMALTWSDVVRVIATFVDTFDDDSPWSSREYGNLTGRDRRIVYENQSVVGLPSRACRRDEVVAKVGPASYDSMTAMIERAKRLKAI